MVTRFKTKLEAEQFIRDLEKEYGVGVFHRIYKGHRDYCVQHDLAKQPDDFAKTTAVEG